MSFGDSYRHMCLQLFRFAIMLALTSVGGYYADLVGLVAAVAAAQALFYPVLRFMLTGRHP